MPFLRQALVAMPLLVAAGCLVVWTKSAQVGMPAIARPVVAEIRGRVLEREEQPAEGRVRLLLAACEPGGVRAIRVRINLPVALDRPDIAEGAVIIAKSRHVSMGLGVRFVPGPDTLEVFTPAGEPFLSFVELGAALDDARAEARKAREAASQSDARASALAARLRALGVDPDSL